MYGISSRENREVPWSPGGLIAGRAARGTPRRIARDERSWEVRRLRSTCEAAEQARFGGCGGGGGKAARPRGTRPAKRVPDAEPGTTRQVRWIACVVGQWRTRRHGSLRCCITSTPIALRRPIGIEPAGCDRDRRGDVGDLWA
jgi:hypothetical protein